MKTGITSAEILARVGQVIAPLPSQAGYMKDLAGLLAMHINRNELIDQGYRPEELPTPSAIVVAATGQGKTYLLKKMAQCLDLNLIVVDCATLVGESYKGVSLSQRLAGAMEEARNEKAFLQSLIFFDEVDKLCSGASGQASGMTSILQLFNGGSVEVSGDDRKSRSVDVSRFSVIMGGAFAGLEDIVRERLNPRAKIGFSASEQALSGEQDWRRLITANDLCRYGLMMELLGRVGTILTIPPLGLEDYRQLLNAESGSLRMKYNNYLRGLYGVELKLTDGAVDALAKACMQDSETGARAADPLMAGYMRKALVQAELDKTLSEVILDAEEERLTLRYEHGKAKQAKHGPDVHVIRGKNPEKLISRLCRYYRNAGCDPAGEEQWKVFLNSAIYYLYKECRKEDFSLDSLGKLAAVTHRKNNRESTFEHMLRKSFFLDRENLKRIDEVYTDRMSMNLVGACRAVRDYLGEKHGTRNIRFQIKGGHEV